MRYPGCVNGKCNLPWECICDNGWHGKKCDKEGNAPVTESYEGSGHSYPPGHGLHGLHPDNHGSFPHVGKRDTDSDARESIMKVTQALASTDYDVEDKDVTFKRSVEDTVTTDTAIPVLLTTSHDPII